ncbi:MAG: hypothetical protein EI684_01410 [Candidatus Viridilinea halotolerans]|uniref:Uncharacterized protein n=1 Tax=Candidatus Viridilinea halotolerans TaxID=2491704 RepID=A0A426UAC8_9CHLR|nr:MAG: hypothetical protein EI684_01410 [Candidatus Viridilinea halotolerans]
MVVPTALTPSPLQALVAIAEPTHGSDAFDLSGEVALIRMALGELPTVVLPAPCTGERATLVALAAGLRAGAAIFWLVAPMGYQQSAPCVYLEQPDGTALPMSAYALADFIVRNTGAAPRLLLLTAGNQATPAATTTHLATFAQTIAHHGIPCVLTLPTAWGDMESAPWIVPLLTALESGQAPLAALPERLRGRVGLFRGG